MKIEIKKREVMWGKQEVRAIQTRLPLDVYEQGVRISALYNMTVSQLCLEVFKQFLNQHDEADVE
jgi:hypothetical protein